MGRICVAGAGARARLVGASWLAAIAPLLVNAISAWVLVDALVGALSRVCPSAVHLAARLVAHRLISRADMAPSRWRAAQVQLLTTSRRSTRPIWIAGGARRAICLIGTGSLLLAVVAVGSALVKFGRGVRLRLAESSSLLMRRLWRVQGHAKTYRLDATRPLFELVVCCTAAGCCFVCASTCVTIGCN